MAWGGGRAKELTQDRNSADICGMRGWVRTPVARRLGYGLIAVAITVIVIATQHGHANSRLRFGQGPVYVELAHPTVQLGMPDEIQAVNRSGLQVAMISCSEHTTASLPANPARAPGLNCGSETPIAPHARLFLGSPSPPYGAKPGTFWVWFGYVRPGRSARVQMAYAKVTVLAPPKSALSLVLAHATIRPNSFDSVEAVNRTGYPVATSGAAMIPRTSATFRLPLSQGIAWDVPSTGVAPHSAHRLSETLWPTYPPGKYWVWTAYDIGGSPTTLFAHTKLTITAR